MSELLLGCSLSAAEYADVTAAYARAAALYTATAEFRDERARVDLCGPKAPIKALLDDMIAREGGCCAHIQFEVAETADGYRVQLSVPGAPGLAAAALRQAVPAFFPTATVLNGEALAAIPTISRDELAARLDRDEPLVLVEALPEMYYRKAHLPHAINIPLESFDLRIATLLPDKQASIVVYCANLACKNSSIAAARLIELGYRDVRDYAEGKQDWIDSGLPTERGIVPRAA